MLDFCAEDPIERVFIEDLVRRGGGRLSAIGDGERLLAVAHIGVNVVPSGQGCAAFAALVDTRARMIIGGEEAVAELWDAVARQLPAPREDRPGQPVYVMDEEPEPGESGLRDATVDDLDLLVPACAAAHREELGSDPLRADAEGFRWRTRAQIEDGRSWIWTDNGTILFKAEASAWTPSAVQLQQVWVDPEVRNRGHAQRALRDLCRGCCSRRRRGLPVRAAGKRTRDPPVREDRDAPPGELLEACCCDRPGARRGVHPPSPAHRSGRRGDLSRLRRRPTRPASGTCSRSLGYRVTALTSTTACAARSPRRTPASAASSSGPRSWTAGPRRDGGRAPRDPLLVRTDRLRATGHTASDQVETVLYRLAASGVAGGIKPKREDGVVRPLLEALARRDRGLLPRRGPALPHGHVQPGHEARAHPRAAPPASARAPPRRREEPAAARRATPVEARRAARVDRRLPPRRPGPGAHRGAGIRASLARTNPCRARGRVRWGAWTIESELEALRYGPGDQATGSPGAARRSRTCSSTPRSPDPSARRGLSWYAATGSSPFPGSSMLRV